MNDIDKSFILLVIIVLLTGIIHWSIWAIGFLGLYLYDKWEKYNLKDELLIINNNHSSKSNMFMSREDKIAYMLTEQWKQLKCMLMLINGNKCEICGNKHNLEAHHTTYNRLGDELLDDLVLLCRSCHKLQHDEYGYDRTTIYLPLIKVDMKPIEKLLQFNI